MKTQTIGDITIDKILEAQAPFFPLADLLPGLPPDLLADNADWLKPRYVDPKTDFAILSFHSMLVRTERHTILIDCCVGNGKERTQRPGWHHAQFPWLENLAARGVRPEEVDCVLCTHLHADHVGWNTRLRDGRWVPTFPNARYIFARREYDYWEKANREHAGDEPLNHGSYLDSVLPIVEAGRADLVGDDHQIEEGIWLEPAPGHTPGNVVVRVERGGDRAVIAGDVLHTPAQLADPSRSSRFCLDPVASAASRARLIDSVADTGTLFLTAHFPTPTAGRVMRRGDGFWFQSV